MISKNSIFGGFFAFILAPFISAIYAIMRPGEKWTYLVLAGFTALYGFFAIVPEASDFYRYLHTLDTFSWSDASDYGVDRYAFYVTGIVSLFTRDGHVLMAVFGFIYGLLFAFSLQFFSERRDMPWWLFIFFLLLYANFLNLNGLGGVRFYTASFLFFIGVYGLITKPDLRSLVLLALIPFVHFSFIVYLGIFCVYYLLKKHSNTILIIFILSFILNIADVGSLLTQYSTMFGDDIADRGNAYINSNLEDMKKAYQGAFWTQIGMYFRYCSYAALVLIYFHAKKYHKKYNHESVTAHMFLFCLVLGTFGNIFDPVPHLGIRTQNLYSAMLILPLFRYCRDHWHTHSGILKLAVLVLGVGGLLKILVAMRIVADFTPISLVCCPLPFVNISDSTVYTLLGL